MSDLPAVRLAIYKPVFCYTRVYYIGPIILKQSKKNKGKLGTIKMLWCSLNTFNYQIISRFKYAFFHFSAATIHSAKMSTKNDME